MLRLRYIARKYLSFLGAIFVKKRLLNVVFNLILFMFKKETLKTRPSVMMIEPTNRCNFSCSLCVLGSGLDKRPFMDLSFGRYKNIIDGFSDYIIWVMLYIQGEPLLNRDIFKMIRYSKKKKIYISLSTNGYFLNQENIKQVLDSGLDHMTISLDAAREDTYKKYKKIDAFYLVISNIKSLVNQRNKLCKLHPCICLQMIVMRDNEDQIIEFSDLAKQIGADEVFIKPARVDLLSEKFIDFLPKHKKYIRRSYLDTKERRRRCLKPWVSFVINSSGVASPCCEDALSNYPIGYVSHDPIDKIWNSEKMEKFRHDLSYDIEKNKLCRDCSFKTFLRLL